MPADRNTPSARRHTVRAALLGIPWRAGQLLHFGQLCRVVLVRLRHGVGNAWRAHKAPTACYVQGCTFLRAAPLNRQPRVEAAIKEQQTAHKPAVVGWRTTPTSAPFAATRAVA